MAIDAFSDYLRGNLESLTQEDLIPFERELEHTRAYLELERLSGQKRFAVKYDLNVTDFMLPPLVLQPLAENAVKHGSIETAQAGEAGEDCTTLITVATYEQDGDIYIEVSNRITSGDRGTDTGMASMYDASRSIEPDSARNCQNKKSIALENIRTRLAIQCGGTLDIDSSEAGTKALIIVPK